MKFKEEIRILANVSNNNYSIYKSSGKWFVTITSEERVEYSHGDNWLVTCYAPGEH